jgi:putative ABC transport system substrate-binding protein
VIGRRKLIVVAASIPCSIARAQIVPQRVPRLAILSLGSTQARPVFAALRQGLGKLGYVEGTTIRLEFHFAHGSADRLKLLAKDLVRSEPDIVLADGGVAASAMQAETRSVPIVAVGSIDPALRSVASSLSRPGGNVTGITTFAVEIPNKQLEVLLEIVPAARRIGVVGLQVGAARDSLNAFASSRGIEIYHLQVVSPADVDEVLTSGTLDRLDGLIVAQNPATSALSHIVVKRINASRKAAIYVEREYLDVGGLASYGVDFAEVFRRLATFIDRILRGASPADIPIEQPTRLGLVLNLRSARALGLAIPVSLQARADELIE